MHRTEREHCCRRIFASDGGSPLPFALTGSAATYPPDRVCDVEHIKIEVTLDFDHKRVEGKCTHSLRVLNQGSTRLRLNAVEMVIKKVHLDGKEVPFSYDGRELAIELGNRSETEKLTLAVDYYADPRRGLYFIAPDEGYPDRPTQAWTQGQDEDNRYWFPCFDHPHEKSTSEVIATVPENMTVLSNGVLLQSETVGTAQRRFHYRHDVAHSSYLITLVAGEFHKTSDRVGDLELDYLVPPSRKDDAARTFARTPAMIELFAKLTGQPYPYSRYSQVVVSEFIFGGMENTSATTLTVDTLHDARAHRDFSSEPLISHELAHQWFGDLLTCREWSEGWLNEGFATYFEIIWRAHIDGGDEADYDRLADWQAYFDEVSHRYQRPIVTRVFHEPIDVFDRHLYEKGGAVLHMLRTELGEARFWKAIRHYVARHKGRSVETRDFARAIDEATGYNGDRFFDQWVFSAGHPDLEIDYSFDDDANLAKLSITQKQESLFTLSLPVRFVVGQSVVERKLGLQSKTETFVIALQEKPRQVVIDPGNHFLKVVKMKKPDELWFEELAHGDAAIDRVLAARALGQAAQPTANAALAQAMQSDPFWAVRGEAALALGEIKTSAARDLLLAAVGKEKHAKARRQILRALGQFRHDSVVAEAIAEKLHGGDDSYFVEAETALTLAKTRAATAFDSLREVMARPSYLDVIASSCLSGMAELRDERGIEVALIEARYGRPHVGRRAAIAALGSLGALFPGRKKPVFETLLELLEDRDFRARIAAVEALRSLGDADAVGALGRASERDLDGRVRRRAREVARLLSEGAAQNAQIQSLRESLEKLETAHRETKERISKLESV